MRPRTLLFFGVVLLLCSWHSDSGLNDNSVSRATMVAALVKHGTLSIDAYHSRTGDKALINGHYYSDKAPLPALIVTPIWWLADRTGITQTRSRCLPHALLQVGGFLCGSLPLALIITLLWLRLRRSGARWPALLAMLPLIGSFLFVYSSSFYGHLMGALFVLLALIAWDRGRYTIAGLWCGAAVLCEYTLAVFPLCWALLLLLRGRDSITRELPRFALGGLPGMIALLGYNALLTGHPLASAYQYNATHELTAGSFDRPTWEAILGLSVSSYRGLLFYMPVLIVGTAAWGVLRRKTLLQRPGPVMLGSIVLFLVITMCGMWWGGWAYGPRHLTAVAVLLAWRTLPLVARVQWAFWPAILLSAFGFVSAFMAKSTVWYSLPTGELDPLSTMILPNFLKGEFTNMQWPVELGLSPMAGTICFVVTFAGALLTLYRMDRSTTT